MVADGLQAEKAAETRVGSTRMRWRGLTWAHCLGRHRPDTPLRRWVDRAELVQKKVGDGSATRDAGVASHSAANSRYREPRLREEIIGRRSWGLWPHITTASRNRSERQLLALLHQPSRQQGGGSFFHPDVKQLNDFLAHIRGVGQPRKFVTLQRRSRSGAKKIPRRLRLDMAVHVALLRKAVRYHFGNIGQG